MILFHFHRKLFPLLFLLRLPLKWNADNLFA